MPPVLARCIGKRQAIVVEQIARRFRFAVAGEIGRTRTGDNVEGCQLARNQALIGERTDAYSQFKALLSQVDDAVVQCEIDPDLGMQLAPALGDYLDS